MNADQEIRAECLEAARDCLSSTRPGFPTTAVDPIDLVTVARYIENGDDPYALREPVDREAPFALYVPKGTRVEDVSE